MCHGQANSSIAPSQVLSKDDSPNWSLNHTGIKHLYKAVTFCNNSCLCCSPIPKLTEAFHREVAKSFFCQPIPNADDLVNLEEDQNSENNGQKKKKKAYFSNTLSKVIQVSKLLTSMQTHTLTKWIRNTQSKMYHSLLNQYRLLDLFFYWLLLSCKNAGVQLL